MCGFVPGPFVNVSIQIGSIRVMSAFACAIVTPGFSRAIPLYPNPARIAFPRSSETGSRTSKSLSTIRNPRGITPTISFGRESTEIFLPTTVGSPPNFRCQ